MIAYQCDRPGCGVLYQAREGHATPAKGIVYYPYDLRGEKRIAHLCEKCEATYVRYWTALQKVADGTQ